MIRLNGIALGQRLSHKPQVVQFQKFMDSMTSGAIPIWTARQSFLGLSGIPSKATQLAVQLPH
jgi:hypothetical protein